MADGCITKNGKYSWGSSLISQDLDWMKLIRDYICPELPIRNYDNGGNVLMITNKLIGEWFVAHGCVPRKSLVVEVPNIPQKNVPDFLRGCWDGDGCITSYTCKKTGKIKYTCYLCSGSRKFLKGISQILTSQDINNSICEVRKKECVINGRTVKPQHPHYRLALGMRATYKLVQWLYYPNHKISMPRKMKRAQEIIAYYQNLE